jgi:hypothetical protein
MKLCWIEIMVSKQVVILLAVLEHFREVLAVLNVVVG